MTVEIGPGEPVPYRSISARLAAEKLGVGVELVRGLVHGGQIEGFEKVDGDKRRVYVREGEAERLAERMKGVGSEDVGG